MSRRRNPELASMAWQLLGMTYIEAKRIEQDYRRLLHRLDRQEIEAPAEEDPEPVKTAFLKLHQHLLMVWMIEKYEEDRVLLC